MSGCSQGDVADDMAVLRRAFEMLTVPRFELELEEDICTSCSKSVEEQCPLGPACYKQVAHAFKNKPVVLIGAARARSCCQT